jgi:hypothetical protein
VCWYLVVCWRAVFGPASRGVSINDACCLALIITSALALAMREATERSRFRARRTSVAALYHHQPCLSHSPVISSPISHIPTHPSQNASLSDPHGWWWKARLVSVPWTHAHTPRMRAGTVIATRHGRSTNTLIATSDPGVPSVSNNYGHKYRDLRSTGRHHDQPN